MQATHEGSISGVELLKIPLPLHVAQVSHVHCICAHPSAAVLVIVPHPIYAFHLTASPQHFAFL